LFLLSFVNLLQRDLTKISSLAFTARQGVNADHTPIYNGLEAHRSSRVEICWRWRVISSVCEEKLKEYTSGRGGGGLAWSGIAHS